MDTFVLLEEDIRVSEDKIERYEMTLGYKVVVSTIKISLFINGVLFDLAILLRIIIKNDIIN